jgi:hypothetical protein
VARCVDHENWPMLMDQVKFVAAVLVKEGKITATLSGKTVDITHVEGPFYLRKIA